MRNYHQSSHFIINKVFPGLGPILTTGLTFWLTVTNFFFANKPSYKKYKSAKHRVIVSFFRRQRLVKGKRPQICATLIWIGLSELDNSYALVMLWDALRCFEMLWYAWWCFESFSSVLIIAQIDTVNIEYVLGWLKKISLELLIFE